MEYSVCVDALYMNRDFMESVKAVNACGLKNIEFWTWWEGKDIDALAAYIRENDMHVTAFCTRFISLTDPAQRGAYLAGLKESIAVAKKLNCRQLITQTGADTGKPRAEQAQSLADGLKACVPMLTENNITLVVEPLNVRVDHKGYFLSSSDEAAEILNKVGSAQVRMLFDIYHQQITEGDILRHIELHKDLIAHFHAAGNPGRHELYRSELDYGYIFSELRKMGCEGYIGLEYFPMEKPEVGLTRLP